MKSNRSTTVEYHPTGVRRFSHVRIATFAFTTLIASACGSNGASLPDFGAVGDGDILDAAGNEGTGLASPVCNILKPSQQQIVSESSFGSTDIEVKVEDPEGLELSKVVFAFQKDATSVIVEMVTSLPPDGHLVEDLDTTTATTGDQTLLCQVETVDGRKGIAGVPVFVDNEPPVVTPMAAGTQPGDAFTGDLEIAFMVSDGIGVGTDEVEVFVNGDAKIGPPKPVTEDEPLLVTVPASELDAGLVTVQLYATDFAGNKPTVPSWEYEAGFVAPPDFIYGIDAAFPDGFEAEGVRGMVFDGKWVIAAFDKTKGIRLFDLADDGRLSLVLDVNDVLDDNHKLTSTVTGLQTFDIDGDGPHDLAVWIWNPNTAVSSVILLVRTSEPSIFEYIPTHLVGQAPIKSLDAGRLNDDGVLDLVMVTDSADSDLEIGLSDGDGALSWTSYSYAGLSMPHLVGIGDMTGDGANDIVVGERFKAKAVVFPVDAKTGLATAGVNSFFGPPGIAVGPATAMIVGEWRPDGPGSLAVFASSSTNQVYWASEFNSQGNGKVTVTGSLATGLQSRKFVAGDIDADGLDDLVLLCPGSNMVDVYWGNEVLTPLDSPFEPGEYQLMAATNAVDVALADLTGQGPESHLEVAVLHGSPVDGRRLLVIPFDDSQPASARRFRGPVLVQLDKEPLGIAAGRYTKPGSDLDGFEDIAILGDSQGVQSVEFRVASPASGLPTLDPITTIEVPIDHSTGLLTGDLDGNGYDDLLIPTAHQVSPSSPSPTMGRLMFKAGATHDFVAVLEAGDPSTGLSVNQGFYAGNSPTIALLAELDQESDAGGALDLAVVARFDGGGDYLFQPFIGQGDGTFIMNDNPPYPVSESKGPVAVAAGGVAGSPYLDAVVANSKTGDVSIFSALGQAYFDHDPGKVDDFAVGKAPKSVEVADMDGPGGLPDIVTLIDGDVSIMYTVEDSAQMLFEPPWYLGHEGDVPSSMAVADVNLDGYPDIVLASKNGSSVTTWVNMAEFLGRRQFAGPYVTGTGVTPVSLLVEDLDADGCPDIVTADRTGNTVTLIRNLLCE